MQKINALEEKIDDWHKIEERLRCYRRVTRRHEEHVGFQDMGTKLFGDKRKKDAKEGMEELC